MVGRSRRFCDEEELLVPADAKEVRKEDNNIVFQCLTKSISFLRDITKN